MFSIGNYAFQNARIKLIISLILASPRNRVTTADSRRESSYDGEQSQAYDAHRSAPGHTANAGDPRAAAAQLCWVGASLPPYACDTTAAFKSAQLVHTTPPSRRATSAHLASPTCPFKDAPTRLLADSAVGRPLVLLMLRLPQWPLRAVCIVGQPEPEVPRGNQPRGASLACEFDCDALPRPRPRRPRRRVQPPA